MSCISNNTLLQRRCTSSTVFWTLAILREDCHNICSDNTIWCQLRFETVIDHLFFSTRVDLLLLPSRCLLTCASNFRTSRVAFRNSLSNIHVFFQCILYLQSLLVHLLSTILMISQFSLFCDESCWFFRSENGEVTMIMLKKMTVAAAS